MALRAGYYGLKNSVKRSLEKLASDLSGAKIIKTISNGLTLSDAGALSCKIDSGTMEFTEAGELKAKQQGGFKVIDTSNVIVATTQYTGTASYVATVDCAVVAKISTTANTGANVKINDVTAAEIYVQTGVGSLTGIYYLKAGDEIELTSTYTSDPATYTVYGLK